MISTNLKTIKDHKEIKQWIERHNGTPARLGYDSTGRKKDPLTVWFQDEENKLKQTYQALDWDEFFSVFDYHNFVFKYETIDGKDKFIGIEKE